MRWKRGKGQGQVEDRRGAGGPGGGTIAAGAGGLGLGAVLLLLLVNLLGGGTGGGFDPGARLEPFPHAPAPRGGVAGAESDPDEDLVEFVGFVVDHVQDTWAAIFAEAGRTYEPTRLVLFEGATNSGCGFATEASGPFYCPADRRVFLDLDFFRELGSRFDAPGDFAQAYVIAHEFGHHVQTVLGISEEVRSAQQSDPSGANELSVRLELQADCLAGVWAFSAYEDELLESGDLEEGLAAAAAVGDDRIQRQATGRVNPESWTHGSSEQRAAWFRTGFQSGNPSACDTFAE